MGKEWEKKRRKGFGMLISDPLDIYCGQKVSFSYSVLILNSFLSLKY